MIQFIKTFRPEVIGEAAKLLLELTEAVLDFEAESIITGGEDISPTLYKIPEAWHGIEDEIDYNAAKDVNDYILTSYCIEQDIPLLGICRGAQMIGVCSGDKVYSRRGKRVCVYV